jgi:hypothetical protein
VCRVQAYNPKRFPGVLPVQAASRKQPRQVFIIEAMHRNANGKLVKRDLIELLPPR